MEPRENNGDQRPHGKIITRPDYVVPQMGSLMPLDLSLFFFTIFNYCLFVCVCMCTRVCVWVCAHVWCMHMPQCPSEGNRTIPGHPFSFSFSPPCRRWDSNSAYQGWQWETWLLIFLVGPQTEFLCCNLEMQLPFSELSVIWGLHLIQNSPLPLGNDLYYSDFANLKVNHTEKYPHS